jgi:CHASE2 domain-containing sensor protein
MVDFADWIGSRRRWLALRRTAWRGAIYVLPLAFLFAAAVARVAAPDLLDRMSLICLDLYQFAAPRKPEGNTPIRIVDIDDDSLKKIGQWPWPRTLVAQLIDKVREAGASLIAFDIDFAEPDRTSPKLLLPLMAQSGVGAEEAKKLLATLPDPDRRLAEAMGTVPTVTGFILTNHGDTRPPAAKAGFAFAGDDPLGRVASFPAAVDNLPALEAAAAGNGFLNQYTDWDHVVRRVPLLLKFGDKPYPSLAAEVLRLAFGAHGYVGRAAGANGEKNFGEKTGLTAIRVGQLTAPTDDAGRIWLHYAPPRRDRFVSAADVLAGNFDRALFADHIVLVGTSAAGVINDRQATPIARDVPGVEIHAQLIEQILQGSFLVRPDWALGAEVVFTLLCGIGLISGVARIGALPSALLGAAAVAAAVGISWLAFRQAQLLIDPVYPWAVITLVYLVASLLGYLRTEARQREIRNADDTPGALWLGKTGERLGAEILDLEQRPDLSPGAVGNDQGARPGQRLQTGGEVWRLADHAALLRGTRADQIADDDEASGDANPNVQRLLCGEPADRLDDREPGAHRPLGIVLMRLRISEINQHAVAHILGDKAVKAADGVGDAAVVGADDLAQILGIEARGQRRRTNQIAEHHRQLAALGFAGGDGDRGGRQWRFGRAERGDGVEQSAAMADRGDTQLAQILAREPA